jgi:hypothetical protein
VRNEVGLDVSHHARISQRGGEMPFFLDILFHRMSEMAIFQQQSEKRQTKSHSLNVRAQPVAHEMPCYKRVTSITDSGTTLCYTE